MEEKAYTYILQCADKTFYSGWTLDLDRRVTEHNSENSSTKYTRSRQPVKLVYSEEFDGRAKAAKRECEIKALTRKAKIKLIKTKNPSFEA